MHQDLIKKASEIIEAKKDYPNDGMDGYAVVSLIDENGYPTSSTMSISKADGISWLTFLSDADGTKAKRIAKSNKACVCLASGEYHISLTGTMAVITDNETKKANWQDAIVEHFNANWDDPGWAVLRFTTEHYNLFFAADDAEAKGSL